MKAPPLFAALLAGVLLCFPAVTGGQSGFLQGGIFQAGREAAVVRRAKRFNLVPVEEAVPGVFVEMRYKVTSAADKPLYLEDMPCLIHRSTGQKLRKADNLLRAQGYAIKVWDAWRPPEAHQALWEAVRNPDYVVPPSKGLSWHCYGVSVDVTLVKLDGSPVEMPTDFDEFSARAASDYTGGDPEVARRVALLQQAMRQSGFRTIRKEWWHFDDMSPRGGVRAVTAEDLGIAMP